MSADKPLIVELENTLNKATAALKKLSTKKMFGCHAVFANENVFALVWKHGRIGVKLIDNSAYEKLMRTKGSEPWMAGPMKMKNWVLVPEEYNKNLKLLQPWVDQAYEQALTAPAKKAAPKVTAKKATKKTTKKAAKKTSSTKVKKKK